MSDPVNQALEGIAVIGLGGRFPGARDIAELWRNLRDGVESITIFGDDELIAAGIDPALVHAPNYVKARGILGDSELIDAPFFGLNPRSAALMDPQHRLFLECAWEALESAGYSPDRQPGRTGVFGGQSMNTYLLTNVYPHLTHVASAESLEAAIGNDKDSLTTEVAYRLSLTGPAVTIQTSSSTSLVAIHYACQSLLGYECDMALAGGVSIHFPEKAGYLYHEGGTTSSDGHCHTFDAAADGFVAGHGAGVVVLRRLADAVASGDTIYAVVKGSAVNNDGSIKVSYMAPSVEGQAEVVALAQAIAGVEPDSIGYVEAHGTATRMGDPIEVAALTQAFRQGTDRSGFCALGSVKTNIGHLDSAAGVAGFIKATLALYHKRIPPSLGYRSPNPVIDFANSPFYVNTRLAEWPKGPTPRRAGVTSLGMGGTNGHIILEEAPAVAAGGFSRRKRHLLLLSARSQPALEAMSDRLGEHLRAHPELDIADVAHTLQVGRKRFAERRALICAGGEDAAQALASREPGRLLDGKAESAGRPVMFMFSGQGAQTVGMARELYESEPRFRAEVDGCADKLTALLDDDLRNVLFGTDVERLTQTAWAQPALFVIEYALARLWMSWGIEPHALIGHSIGEYVAAYLAGVFTLDDALALVAARGRLMQSMPPGTMLAVPLPEEKVRPLLGAELALAAVNTPATCVVSGPAAAIAALAETLAAEGQPSTRLHTSHAFHSAMMDPILEPFRAEVLRVARRAPTLPVISNLTGAWLTAEEAQSPDYWARHLRETVRFATGVGQLLADRDAVLLEVGPGQTLTSLARQHPGRGQRHVVLPSLRHVREQRSDGEIILETLGRLWLSGVEPDWPAVNAPEDTRRRVPLPSYPFERRRHWVEPKARDGHATPGENGTKAAATSWFHRPSWKARPLGRPENGSAKPARWWVFAREAPDHAGLGARLIHRLAEMGHDVVAVIPEAVSDHAALVRRLVAEGQLPDRIVHLWGASPAANGFEAAQQTGFHSLLELVQALDREGMNRPLSLLAVTHRAQSLFGEEPRPEGASVVGLCAVIPQEYPQIACRTVDIAIPAAGTFHERVLCDQLIAESIAGPPEDTVIAYRGVERWVRGFDAIPVPPSSRPRLRERAAVLIFGGFGNLGYAHACALAKQGTVRLALVSRSAALDAARSRKVAELESLGAEVRVLRADVSDAAQVRAAVAEAVAELGPLAGVVFAAGSVDETLFRTIPEVGAADVNAHFRPRTASLQALAEALRGQPLDFCVLSSSLASILGGVGRATYAAAASFMDAFAIAQGHRSSFPWLSVNWDAWQFEAGKVMPRGIADLFGDAAISADEGGEAFLQLLSLGTSGQLAVCKASLTERMARAAQPAAGTSAPPTEAQSFTKRSPRPTLQNPYVAPANEVEATIAGLWGDALGIDEVGVTDNFFELGGNSLVGVLLINRVKDRFDVPIPAVSLYEGPTVRALAALIGEKDAPSAPAEPSKAASRGERRRARRQQQSAAESTPADDEP